MDGISLEKIAPQKMKYTHRSVLMTTPFLQFLDKCEHIPKRVFLEQCIQSGKLCQFLEKVVGDHGDDDLGNMDNMDNCSHNVIAHMKTHDLHLLAQVVSETRVSAEMARSVQDIILARMSSEQVMAVLRACAKSNGAIDAMHYMREKIGSAVDDTIDNMANTARLILLRGGMPSQTVALASLVVCRLHEFRCWKEEHAAMILSLIHVEALEERHDDGDRHDYSDNDSEDLDLIVDGDIGSQKRKWPNRTPLPNSKRPRSEWRYRLHQIEFIVACRPDLLSLVMEVLMDQRVFDDEQRIRFIDDVCTFPLDWISKVIVKQLKSNADASWVLALVTVVKGALDNGTSPLGLLNLSRKFKEANIHLDDDDTAAAVEDDNDDEELDVKALVTKLPEMAMQDILAILHDRREHEQSVHISLQCTPHLISRLKSAEDPQSALTIFQQHQSTFYRFMDCIRDGALLRHGIASVQEFTRIESAVAFLLRMARQHPDSGVRSIFPGSPVDNVPSQQIPKRELSRTMTRAIARLLLAKSITLMDETLLSNLYTIAFHNTMECMPKEEITSMLRHLLDQAMRIHANETNSEIVLVNRCYIREEKLEDTIPHVDLVIDLLLLFHQVLMLSVHDEKMDQRLSFLWEGGPNDELMLLHLCTLLMEKIHKLVQSTQASDQSSLFAYALFHTYHTLFDSMVLQDTQQSRLVMSVFMRQMFEQHVRLLRSLQQFTAATTELSQRLHETILNSSLLIAAQFLRLTCGNTKPYSLKSIITRSKIPVDWEMNEMEEASLLMEKLQGDDDSSIALHRLLSHALPKNLFDPAFKSAKNCTDYHRTVMQTCQSMPLSRDFEVFPFMQASVNICFHAPIRTTSNDSHQFCKYFDISRRQFTLQTLGHYVEHFVSQVTTELESKATSRRALQKYIKELAQSLHRDNLSKQVKISLVHSVGALAYVKVALKCIVKLHAGLLMPLLSNMIPSKDQNVIANSALALNLIVTCGIRMNTMDETYRSTLRGICKAPKVMGMLCQSGLDLSVIRSDVALTQTNLETIHVLLTSFQGEDAAQLTQTALRFGLPKKLLNIIHMGECLDSINTEPESKELFKLILQTMTALVVQHLGNATSASTPIQEPACALMNILATEGRTHVFIASNRQLVSQYLSALQGSRFNEAVKILQENAMLASLLSPQSK